MARGSTSGTHPPEGGRWFSRALSQDGEDSALAQAEGTRYPPSVWSLWNSLLVTVAIAVPVVFALLVAPSLRNLSGAATATEFVVFPAVLLASVLLYFQFRLTGSVVLGWGTLCLTLYAVQGVMLAGLRAGDPGPFFDRPGWILVVDVPIAGLVLVSMMWSSRVRLPVDPLGAGLVVGLIVAGVSLTLNSLAPRLSITSPPVLVAEVMLASLGIAIGYTVYRLDGLPRWFVLRLGVGAFALALNRIASCQNTSDFFHAAAIVTGVVGAALMLNAATAGLRSTLHDHRRSLATLTHQVAVMEAGERDSRERLHEITNSISSIAMASSLLHHHGEVPESKRAKLEHMLDSEAARLARILTNAGGALEAAPEAGDAEVVDLDSVIEPVITSHQALQRPVDWEPSGCVAMGDADAVAEVVNILLDNAARHAPKARTSVEVTQSGNRVEIAVRDDGPGVPADVRRKLFQWGGRGSSSRGQGIGLHLAHRLMTAGGNSLHLEASQSGTSFVIGLPAAEERDS